MGAVGGDAEGRGSIWVSGIGIYNRMSMPSPLCHCTSIPAWRQLLVPPSSQSTPRYRVEFFREIL
jgi:hypothetical protein